MVHRISLERRNSLAHEVMEYILRNDPHILGELTDQISQNCRGELAFEWLVHRYRKTMINRIKEMVWYSNGWTLAAFLYEERPIHVGALARVATGLLMRGWHAAGQIDSVVQEWKEREFSEFWSFCDDELHLLFCEILYEVTFDISLQLMVEKLKTDSLE